MAGSALWAWVLATSLQASPTAGSAALTGTVVDATTTKPVANARVVLAEVGHPVVTGADGRFEFRNLPPRRYTLTVSIIGYAFVRRPVDVAAGAVLDLTVPLSEGTGSYQESVTVKADSTPPPELGVSSQTTLGSAALQDLRGIAADDPLRAMQALPGVATGNDFQAQFSMRGFAFRQIGIVMDGTPTPLLLHEIEGEKDTGSIAMINSDVLSQASLFAGPHPQKDGDWLGSTLTFDMREGSRDRATIRVAVSGTSASTVAEGPIGRSKRGSWLVSIRKSYIDWLIKKIAPEVDGTIGFVDAQGKLAYDLTNRQQVQVTFVAGDAHFDEVDATGPNSLSRATSAGGLLSVAWRRATPTWVLSQRVSFAPSNFLDKGASDQEQSRGDTPSFVYRGDSAWQFARDWSIDTGVESEPQREHLTLRNFTLVKGVLQQRAIVDATFRTTTSDAWGQIARRTARTGVALGARVSTDTFTASTVASPWLLLEARLGRLTFRAGAGETHQFPSLDIQAGASSTLGPEAAQSVDAGIEHAVGRGFSWQITGWTRADQHIIRMTGEDRVVNGKRVAASFFPQFTGTLDGPSRGVDVVLARRSATGITGWISYTYAHTRFRDSATGEQFDGDYDQRHTVNMFVEARISYRFAVNARWRYGSNFPLVGYFSGTIDTLKVGTDYNQVRLPPYSRLDVRANRTFTFQKRRLTLFLEIMNVLNHTNLGQFSGSINSTTLAATGYTTKMIPRVPSAGILIEF